jgi:hypothetical protein
MKNTNDLHPVEETKKINISLPGEIYDLLATNAKKDYLRVATLVKQILMRHLLRGDKAQEKLPTQNENNM